MCLPKFVCFYIRICYEDTLLLKVWTIYIINQVPMFCPSVRRLVYDRGTHYCCFHEVDERVALDGWAI